MKLLVFFSLCYSRSCTIIKKNIAWILKIPSHKLCNMFVLHFDLFGFCYLRGLYWNYNPSFQVILVVFVIHLTTQCCECTKSFTWCEIKPCLIKYTVYSLTICQKYIEMNLYLKTSHLALKCCVNSHVVHLSEYAAVAISR